jgi:hypothetical protein
VGFSLTNSRRFIKQQAERPGHFDVWRASGSVAPKPKVTTTMVPESVRGPGCRRPSGAARHRIFNFRPEGFSSSDRTLRVNLANEPTMGVMGSL